MQGVEVSQEVGFAGYKVASVKSQWGQVGELAEANWKTAGLR